MSEPSVNILVVDDELSVRDSLEHWFRRDGYHTASAKDGAEALKRFQEDRWDVVLIDMKMPGMDGLELQRRIHAVDPEIVSIIFTAYGSVENAVAALKEGAFDYVNKPINPDELAHVVQMAVEQRRLRSENTALKARLEELSGVLPVSPAREALVGDSLAEVEKAHVQAILDRTGWNISRSARILNIDRVTLYNKIKKFELSNPGTAAAGPQ